MTSKLEAVAAIARLEGAAPDLGPAVQLLSSNRMDNILGWRLVYLAKKRELISCCDRLPPAFEAAVGLIAECPQLRMAVHADGSGGHRIGLMALALDHASSTGQWKDEEIRGLIGRAANDSVAFDVVTMIAEHSLSRLGELPSLALWLRDLLAGNVVRPKRPGRPHREKWGRDLCLAWALEEAFDLNFQPTRNRSVSSAGVCACDVVAASFQFAGGRKIETNALESIWSRHVAGSRRGSRSGAPS